MANKRSKPEEIVTKLRRVDVLTAQGMQRLKAIRQIDVTEQTFSLEAKVRQNVYRPSEGTEASAK